MARLTAYDFMKKSPEDLALYSDDQLYKAAVAAKRLKDGKIKVVKC